MNETFNIKVIIDSNHVTTSFSSENNKDMDIALLTSILKIFSDVQNKLKSQVTKYYSMPKEQLECTEETSETIAGSPIVGE